MSDDKYFDEFPIAEGDDPLIGSKQEESPEGDTVQESRFLVIWEKLSRAGLGETVFRAGTHLLSIALVLVVVWGLRAFYLYLQEVDASVPRDAALAAALPTPTPTEVPAVMPAFTGAEPEFMDGIPRQVLLHTTIPTRPRTEVITYTVQTGDTLFGIAEKFGLKPETILWGNVYTLGDDPHRLSPGQSLYILPVNGTYHKWSEGEGLNGVAKGYNVTPEDMINWSGNHLDVDTLGRRASCLARCLDGTNRPGYLHPGGCQTS